MSIQLNLSSTVVATVLMVFGNTLTLVGCVGLLLVSIGPIEAESFAIGISDGVRVVGSVAIAGCLISAIGYWVLEFAEQ